MLASALGPLVSTREWPPSLPSSPSLPTAASLPALPASTAARLWLLALLSYGLGDVATTVVGVHTPGVVETNPLARRAFAHSVVGGMVALKAAAFAGSYLLWRLAPRGCRLGVPLGLALSGVAVTGWNLLVLARW